MARARTRLVQAVPALASAPTPRAILRDDYYGPGYGEPTAESLAALRVFQEQFGIPLEQTYSGKAAAAFLAAQPKANGQVLFWNTYNSRPLEAAVGLTA
jgi:D-cysteine desulfhydrase